MFYGEAGTAVLSSTFLPGIADLYNGQGKIGLYLREIFVSFSIIALQSYSG